MTTTTFTIGYEGATVGQVVDALLDAGVQHVLDVRQIAQSRKPGFSKRALERALGEAGIGYTHRRDLGDPKPGREAARQGQFKLFRAIFLAHLDLPTTREALRHAAGDVTGRTTALLCYERDPTHCHRSMVADRLTTLVPIQVEHLTVGEPRAETGAFALAA